MDAFIQGVTKVVGVINDIVWGWPVIILILGTGLLLTVLTKCLQVRKFKESVNSTIVPVIKGMKKGKKSERTDGSVSQFEAFATAISGTVGTGNIIGVTSAILSGGPGAVFWMWVSAFFGMVTNYAENVLGLYYRKKNEDGSFSGGAFYYITYGIHSTWLGYLAAVFCLIAAVGMSGVQVNKIAGTLTTTFHNDAIWMKLLIGGVVAAIVAVIIIGGIKRIGKVAANLVPFMSLLFILMAVIGICMNITALPKAFGLIFSSIFSTKAALGGLGGYAFGQIIKKGMARGVFSNEAGLGSSVIAHSASDTKEPVKQGLWGVFEVFFDTFVICTLTALLFLTTYIGNGQFESLTSVSVDSEMAIRMFSGNFGVFGTVAFSIILPLFAFTTILAWSYYGEKAMEFCFRKTGEKGKKVAVTVFKVIYVLMIVGAALIESQLVWDIDDAANGLMAIPNLIAVISLSGLVAKITKNYFDRKKGKKVEPMLSAYPAQNREFEKEILSYTELKTLQHNRKK